MIFFKYVIKVKVQGFIEKKQQIKIPNIFPTTDQNIIPKAL